jgi:FkbM family methyltransferase
MNEWLEQLKNTIKILLRQLNIAFTKNQIYDKQTNKIIKSICYADSNCIDVGAHTGDILETMYKYAPLGNHYAFEPVPFLYEVLWRKYQYFTNIKIMDTALSNESGTSNFNYVMSNPAYSGLIKRKYDRPHEQDVTLLVKVDKLDNILPHDYKVDLIKIDVEGGELNVMQGGINTLKKNKPFVIFEHGKGSSEYYNASPDKIFDLLTECGLKISRLADFLKKRPAMSRDKFIDTYNRNSDYYFIAHP